MQIYFYFSLLNFICKLIPASVEPETTQLTPIAFYFSHFPNLLCILIAEQHYDEREPQVGATLLDTRRTHRLARPYQAYPNSAGYYEVICWSVLSSFEEFRLS